MWGGVDMQVEMVGGRDEEIERGVGYFTANGRYWAHAFNIAPAYVKPAAEVYKRCRMRWI
jgi:hypothetical protein